MNDLTKRFDQESKSVLLPHPIKRGVIAEDATDKSDSVAVIVEDFSELFRHGEYRFQLSQGLALPSKDDECLLAYDETGEAWIVAWYSTDGNIELSEARARARAVRNAAFNITNVGWTRIPLDDATFDEAGAKAMFDSTNGWLVCRDAGDYALDGQVNFAADATGAYRMGAIGVQRDGVTWEAQGATTTQPQSAVSNRVAFSGGIATLAVGDRIGLFAIQNGTNAALPLALIQNVMASTQMPANWLSAIRQS
jgi:hypothetical protein